MKILLAERAPLFLRGTITENPDSKGTTMTNSGYYEVFLAECSVSFLDLKVHRAS